MKKLEKYNMSVEEYIGKRDTEESITTYKEEVEQQF